MYSRGQCKVENCVHPHLHTFYACLNLYNDIGHHRQYWYYAYQGPLKVDHPTSKFSPSQLPWTFPHYLWLMAISLQIRIILIFGPPNTHLNTLKKLEYEYIILQLKEFVNPIISRHKNPYMNPFMA